MEELSKKVNKLNQDPEIIDIIIENEDEIIKNTMYEKGIEHNKIETAKNLLKNNVDINIIVDSTGLSKEQIKELRN